MATSPQYKTAYEDASTRHGWRLEVLNRLAWLLAFWALSGFCLFLAFISPTWLTWLYVLVIAALGVCWVYALAALLNVRRMRQILKTYPWQSFTDVTLIAKDGRTAVFRIPDPERPDDSVSLRHGRGPGSGLTFWVRRIKSQAVEEIWFAGDPRFLAVVAVPGPRRMINLAQPEALNPRMSPRKKGVGREARERARAVGARIG